MLTISVSVLGMLGACASTSTMKVSEAAPVTYKIGEGNSSYAAVRMPQRPTTHVGRTAEARPSPLARPAPVIPQRTPQTSLPRSADVAPMIMEEQETGALPEMPGRSMVPELANIDRNVYPHMKIGNTYKVAGKSYTPKHDPDYDNIGIASWYGDKFHGKPTANGEAYDKRAMTAAHKTLPLNSYVWVTNLDTGKSIKVRLNDRGPFIDGRIIDLSEAAAEKIGIAGLGKVRVQYAGPALPSDSGKRFSQTQATPHAGRVVPQPVMPTPAPTPAPARPVQPQPQSQPVQPAPQVTTPRAAETELPAYRPLRDMGSTPEPTTLPAPQPTPTPAPEYSASQNNERFEVPSIMGAPSGGTIALPQTGGQQVQALPPIPTPETEIPDDGIVTLTIKGPIHMAKSEGSLRDRPEYIPASYDGEK